MLVMKFLAPTINMNIAGAPPHLITQAYYCAATADRHVLFQRIQMHVIHALVVKMIAIDSDKIGAVFMPCGFSAIPGVSSPLIR